MDDSLKFATRADFREWLETHGTTHGGVWLLFGKSGGPVTLKAGEALEEALCFGWIDGQMKSLDDTQYKKYFALRTAQSNWSDKNKALAVKLEEQGIMTDLGRSKIEEAKKNGQWNATRSPEITTEDTAQILVLLAGYEQALANFQAMSPSVQKTYTRAYFAAKTDAGKESRFTWMVDRLNKNLKPM